MSDEKKQIEEVLVEQARQAIRKMLSNLPDVTEITLSDMEQLTGEMGKAVMQETMQKLAETQHAEAVMCEVCQVKMQKRGKRKKRVLTARGEIEIERQYYVCPACKTGHFPPG